MATDAVAVLRSEAGRAPYDRDLSDLVGELSMRSDAFRTRSAAHDVCCHDTSSKGFHHPPVGELNLTYGSMQPVAAAGPMPFVSTDPARSKAGQAMNLLASSAATPEKAELPNPSDR